jgi:hypothetical protein
LREYAFDIKMFAVIRVLADTRAKAEVILSNAVDRAKLDVTDRSGKPLKALVAVDDEGFPYLVSVDGMDVDDDEDEADDFDLSG